MGEPADPEIGGDNEGVTGNQGDKDRDLDVERRVEEHEVSFKGRAVPRDSSLDENDQRHVKKKKKKRHRSRSRCASFTEPGSETTSKSDAAGGGQHDTDESDDDEDPASVVVSSSTIRKKKSRSSSRHRHRKHKKADADAPGHDDSGLSLGNSLNGSSTASRTNEIADGTATESINATTNGGETVQKLLEEIDPEKANDVHVNDDVAATIPKSDDTCDVENNVLHDDRKANGVEKNSTITNSADMSVNSALLHDSNGVTETALSQEKDVPFETINESEADSSSKVMKTRRLGGRERDYSIISMEGEMLKEGNGDTRGTCEEEDRNVSEHQQQPTALPQLPGQQGSLHAPFRDVAKLEEELEYRFKECMERQAEIEEMERYLNMRESLCKSKERDLGKLDDELDAWQGELDIKKKQLEMEDSTRRRFDSRACTSSNHPRSTTDEEDYILKKNLLKCQADLARSEEENSALHKELDMVKNNLASSETQRRSQDAKIKQLETQLTIALQQISDNKKTSHAHGKSSLATLPPITNGQHLSHAPSTTSTLDELKRERERERSHVMLQRLNSSNHGQQLSINQEAALRRKLSGKDGPSASKLQPPDRGVGTVNHRKASSSAGSAHSGERGSSSRSGGGNGSPARSDVSMEMEASRSASSPERRNDTLEKSSVCVVM